MRDYMNRLKNIYAFWKNNGMNSKDIRASLDRIISRDAYIARYRYDLHNYKPVWGSCATNRD